MFKKILIIVVLALSFGIPYLAYSQSISEFRSEPIQMNPQMGQGDRFVGNTQVQIVAPPASSTKISGENTPSIPESNIPENISIPDKAPYTVMPSLPRQSNFTVKP